MKKFPIHTILLALFPVLFLYSINIAETSVTETTRPALVLLAFSGLLWLILFLLTKNIIKAGLIVSVILLLTFLFGPVRDIITPLMWSHPQRYLFAAESIFLVLSIFLIFKMKRNLENTNFLFNIIAIVLVGTSIISAASTYLTGQKAGNYTKAETISAADLVIPDNLPDIYYIITDGYGRSDVLSKLYSYDNSNFIDYLKSKGFFVADKSLSNYSQTTTSLPSSLNMTYIDEVAKQMGKSSANVIPLVNMIKSNQVSKLLKDIGYTTVAFSTGYWDTELKDCDIFLSSDQTKLTDFESLVLDMTPASKILSKIYTYHYDSRRETITFALNNLGKLPKTNKPKFVFAHIPAPHEPYVFDEYGNEIEPSVPILIPGKADFRSFEEKNRRYCNFAEWLNSRLILVLDNILKDSSNQPIIILQADHGSNSYLMQGDSSYIGLIEKHAILNAYYFPDRDYTNLYDSISPVNSFRVIFNQYFGAELEMLADKNQFSRFDTPYDLIDVTKRVTKPLPEIKNEPTVHKLEQ